ncbi:MAG: hypothetical protein B2I17_01565 [Thermoplasmatales archaeon B_DKE]|nr:MAG: hypothetical protein B2I17_01565 [Thermoplasmatales archaeon B_DKE]
MPQNHEESVDVLIRTFNSADTLENCLESVTRYIPVKRILMADHNSTDATPEIAARFGVELFEEEKGLGYATNFLISKASTKYVLFVDGDISVVSDTFFAQAMEEFKNPRTGAVVGCALGHNFLYGIPLGLTMMPLQLARKINMPDEIQGRETFYFEEVISDNYLKIQYIKDAMIHRSVYRNYRYWPEWQGAQIRMTPSRHFSQLAKAIIVVWMMHLNSKSAKNFLYSPIYYLKLLTGFMNPAKWGKVDRRKISGEVHR